MSRISCILMAIGLMSIMSVYAQDFTLGIFGNAIMDDLIDDRDVAYVEGILDNANEKTNLADANQDGKVDEGDIDRIRQIIDGIKSELYYIDCNGDVNWVRHPLKKIILVKLNFH